MIPSSPLLYLSSPTNPRGGRSRPPRSRRVSQLLAAPTTHRTPPLPPLAPFTSSSPHTRAAHELGPQPTPRPGPRCLQWPQASGLAASAGPSPLSEPVGSPLRAPSLRLRPLLSALPGEGGGGGGCLSGENSSGSHPLHRLHSGNLGGLSLGLRHQRADTDPPLSCLRRLRLSCRPLPQLAAINGKMAASALARIRALGRRARRLAPTVARQLSLAFNHFSSSSGPGGTKLAEQLWKRFFDRGSLDWPSRHSLCRRGGKSQASASSRTVTTPCPGGKTGA